MREWEWQLGNVSGWGGSRCRLVGMEYGHVSDMRECEYAVE